MNIVKPGDTGRRRIAAVGMWDGVHCGHRFLVDFVRRQAQERGLVPSVVTFRNHPLTVVRPESVPPLITGCDTRLALLDAAGVADCVLLDFNERMRRMSAREFLEMLKHRYAVDTLVVGFNNRFGHDRACGPDAYAEIGRDIDMEVIAAPEFRHRRGGVSSSVVRDLIARGCVDRARELLGRPFTLSGAVVAGRQLGRQLGFPTANINVADKAMLIPGNGVYAAVARTPDGVRRQAIVNIGRRPTVDRPGAPVTVEAHILDFAGDLYSRTLMLEFVALMRHEKAFEGVDNLKRQLQADERRARRLLKNV